MTASNTVFPFETAIDWYRQPSVTVAFVLSLLAHAAAIALFPGLRVPKPIEPVPIVVELVSAPVIDTPAPVLFAAPAPLPVVQPPPPAQKKQAEPPPPPPIIQQAPEPEPPKPKSQAMPPAEMPPPPQLEPRSEPTPQPLPETQVAAPAPTAAQPYVEPQAEVRAEPPPPPNVPTPVPVVPVSPPALDPNALKSYGSVLTGVISKRKRYPRTAQLRGWQGTTELRVLVSSDGKLKDVTVAHSSGFDVLDQQAVSMVKESLPLPDVPQSLRGREFAINVPVAFRLE